MTNTELKEKLVENGLDEVILFDLEIADAFVAVSADSRAIYDYNKIIDCLIEDGICEDEHEAVDYINHELVQYSYKKYMPIIAITN